MASTVFPAASSASSPPTITGVPSGLTLRNTYTSTTSGLSYPVSQVYVVAAGGGGGGGGGGGNAQYRTGGGGGGGGAVVQGWLPATFTSVTIGDS